MMWFAQKLVLYDVSYFICILFRNQKSNLRSQDVNVTEWRLIFMFVVYSWIFFFFFCKIDRELILKFIRLFFYNSEDQSSLKVRQGYSLQESHIVFFSNICTCLFKYTYCFSKNQIQQFNLRYYSRIFHKTQRFLWVLF